MRVQRERGRQIQRLADGQTETDRWMRERDRQREGWTESAESLS